LRGNHEEAVYMAMMTVVAVVLLTAGMTAAANRKSDRHLEGGVFAGWNSVEVLLR
jgi:hypothetical protein